MAKKNNKIGRRLSPSSLSNDRVENIRAVESSELVVEVRRGRLGDADSGADLGLDHPGEVMEGRGVHRADREDDHHVHDVVRVEEHVHSAGKPLLRDAHCADRAADHCYQVLQLISEIWWFK